MAPVTSSSMPGATNLFGRVSMGYSVIESERLPAWRRLLDEGLGMEVSDDDGSLLRARMDDHACRFLVRPGPAEDLCALGLELSDEEAFREVIWRLKARGIEPQMHGGDEARLRGVKRYWAFKGPKGLQIDLYFEPLRLGRPPALRATGFVTGAQGFGHMAFVTRRPDETLAFWKDLFDIRYTDEVHQRISGVPLDFQFLRFNARHHSIALASTPRVRLNPIRTTLQHVEVQVASLDDIGLAYRRCRALKIPIAMGVGQHANDRAISFYAKTPSGFDFEYGWNPVAVDEAAWTPEVWRSISDWGHRPEHLPASERLGQLARAVASLGQREYVPAG